MAASFLPAALLLITRLHISGVYHVEPQSSAYPFSFPFGDTPVHWHADAQFRFTEESIFWFNFFPAQPLLFEKTFVVWALFQMLQLKGRGENNQLVALDNKARLSSNGIDDFVQVNLNRFTSLPGFFNAAHEAGKHTFTVDPDYLWYGMLLSKVCPAAPASLEPFVSDSFTRPWVHSID